MPPNLGRQPNTSLGGPFCVQPSSCSCVFSACHCIVIVQDRTWLSLIGFTSGVLVSIANVLQFLGGQAAGGLFSLPFLQLTDDVNRILVKHGSF